MDNPNGPTTIEKFVAMHLSQTRVEPHLTRAVVDGDGYVPPDRPAAAQQTRKASLAALVFATMLFASGVGVGYLLSDHPQASPLSTHLTDPGDAAILRIDYDLRYR